MMVSCWKVEVPVDNKRTLVALPPDPGPQRKNGISILATSGRLTQGWVRTGRQLSAPAVRRDTQDFQFTGWYHGLYYCVLTSQTRRNQGIVGKGRPNYLSPPKTKRFLKYVFWETQKCCKKQNFTAHLKLIFLQKSENQEIPSSFRTCGSSLRFE